MSKRSAFHIIFSIVLASCSLSALAGDGERGERGERGGANRDEARAERQGPRQERERDARAVQQSQAPVQRQIEPRSEQPEVPGQGDAGRRNGRMSPEERRALRRQIDQASHDIYPPGR